MGSSSRKTPERPARRRENRGSWRPTNPPRLCQCAEKPGPHPGSRYPPVFEAEPSPRRGSRARRLVAGLDRVLDLGPERALDDARHVIRHPLLQHRSQHVGNRVLESARRPAGAIRLHGDGQRRRGRRGGLGSWRVCRLDDGRQRNDRRLRLGRKGRRGRCSRSRKPQRQRVERVVGRSAAGDVGTAREARLRREPRRVGRAPGNRTAERPRLDGRARLRTSRLRLYSRFFRSSRAHRGTKGR